MQKKDFQLIEYIGLGLGTFFCLIGGTALVFYYLEIYRPYITFIAYFTMSPYAQFSIISIIAGIGLLIVGSAFSWRADQEKS